MKDYELKISQFVDNELSAIEQQELFRYLSENRDAQQTLVDFMEMKKETKSFYSGMNTDMDDSKIVTAGISAQYVRGKKYKTMFYFTAAASIIFIFLFLASQFKKNPFLAKYQNLQVEMITLQENYSDVLTKQTRLIELNNQLNLETKKLKSAKVVRQNLLDRKDSKVQTLKIGKQQKNRKGSFHSTSNASRMLASLKNVQTIEITKNDFLGGQIIGN